MLEFVIGQFLCPDTALDQVKPGRERTRTMVDEGAKSAADPVSCDGIANGFSDGECDSGGILALDVHHPYRATFGSGRWARKGREMAT
jgi:hypothetical protein